MVRPRKPINPGPLGEPERLGPSSRSFVKGRYATTGHRAPAAPTGEDDGLESDGAPPGSKYAGRATAASPPGGHVESPSRRREQEPAPVAAEPEDPSISFTIDLDAVEDEEPSKATYYQRHRAELPRLGIEPVDREEEPAGPPLRWALLERHRKRR